MTWFAKVCHWRTGASAIWLLMLATPLMPAHSLLTNSIWSMYWVRSVLCTLLYYIGMIIIHISHSWICRVSVPVSKTRLQKITNQFRPSQIAFVIIHVVAGAIISMSIVSSTCGSTLTWMSHGSFIGLLYSLNYIRNQDFVLLFPIIQQWKFFRIKSYIIRLLKISICQSVKAELLYIFIHFIYSRAMYGNVVPSISLFFNINSLWLFFMNGFILYFILYLSLKLYRVYHTEAIAFPIISTFNEESSRTLTFALSSTNEFLKHMAYYDLYTISLQSTSRRGQVYSLSAQGTPAVWNDIYNQCMQCLNGLITLLGGVVDEAGTVPPVEEKSKMTYRKGWSNDWNGLSRRYVNTERAALHVGVHGLQHLQYIPDKTPSGSNKKIIKDPWKEIVESFKFLKQQITNFLKRRKSIAFFISELPEAKSEEIFSNALLYMWIITAVSYLSAHSYSEDQYGVVQKSLQQTFNTLLQLSTLLQKHCHQPLSQPVNLNSSKLISLKMNGKYALKRAVEQGIQLLSNTFQNELRFIQLSSESLKRLTKFS